MVNIQGDKDAVEKAAELKQKLEAVCNGYGLEGSLKGEGRSYSGTYRTPKEKKKKDGPPKYDYSQYMQPVKKEKKGKKEKKAKKVENTENAEYAENALQEVIA
jgi:hypothetical protein